MARKATVSLPLFVVLAICGAAGVPAYGQLTIEKIETGDPISATGYDEVFRGVTTVKVRMTVWNQTGDPLEIDCDPARTGPRFFQNGTPVDGDYDYVIDPGTTCPIQIPSPGEVKIIFWVSAPFPTVNESPPSITVDGAVGADGPGGPDDVAGAIEKDDWHMFEQVTDTFGDIAASSGVFLVWNVDAVDCGSGFGFAVALGNVTDNCANDSIVGALRCRTPGRFSCSRTTTVATVSWD